MFRLSPITVILLALLLSVPRFAGAEQPSKPDDATAIAELSKKYSLTIVTQRPTFPVSTFYGSIRGKEAPADQLSTFLPILASEFGLYPAELVKRTGLKQIILCDDLAFAGQLRTAIPDFEHDHLYLDVVRGRYDETYVRKVIHHEFFHIVDYRDDGKLYTDERWLTLNAADFKYGNGGKNVQDDATVSLLHEGAAGFLTKYSMAGVEEDKAELFCHMIVLPKVVQQRSQKDPVLRMKTQRMRELVQRFCPDADERFWDAAAKLSRPANEPP